MITLPQYIRPKLFCSFSGGRTSGYMAYWIKQNLSDTFDIRYIFANTGQEHEKTLEFVNRCDQEWGLNVVWIEPVVHYNEKKSSTHKIVDYHTATRDGSLFENMAKKYGIPSMPTPFCTRELKVNPMKSYVRSLDWKAGSYVTAIGLRSDEMDRVNENFEKELLWYPLISLGVTKEKVRSWWASMPFDLDLPEHLGNCTWCWKKSLRKHLTLAKDYPELFEVPKMLEEKYRFVGPTGQERFLFRGNRNTQDILELSKMPFEHFTDTPEPLLQLDLDLSNGCSESCEVYTA